MPSTLDLAALLLTLAAGFGLANHWFVRLPRSVGLLVIAFAASVVLIGVDVAVPWLGLRGRAAAFIEAADLPHTLLDGALSFLLFAGAMQVDISPLWSRKWTVLMLATAGTIVAALIAGGGIAVIFDWVGHPVPLAWCLVFGAIMAPTDPVAVLDVMKRIGLRPTLQTTLVAESLFNDGVGVVLFGLFLGIATGTDGTIEMAGLSSLFLIEAFGGVALGLATGYAAFLAIRRVDEFHLEVLLSLALVVATYSLAKHLHVSGPIAEVVAGILVGNRAMRLAGGNAERAHMATIWSVIDEILNALLFLMIGLEILVVPIDHASVGAALLAIPLALLSRFLSVVVTSLGLHWRAPDKGLALATLTWAGVRGGIAVALALSLPNSPYRGAILAASYTVVLFNIVVQGLTVEPVLRRFRAADRD
jgi:CPA1 family monovalent cation:H+ antiporter